MSVIRRVFILFLESLWLGVTAALSILCFALVMLAIVQPLAVIILLIIAPVYYVCLSSWARRRHRLADAALLLGLHVLVFLIGLLFMAMDGLEPILLWISSGF
ncbi:hypothetical protein ATDW_22280 [Asticcacaulis sp. DW145]|uniref:hypothetical protein n=1 Tax=Asticcacaulis sp. DW145 TaxID=3095608 RepID=UPI003092E2CC|nr:hypothetical protein ATDW_22280 [Asticcacaulis sp. DW145]